MSNKKKLLGASAVTNSYAITLLKDVRQYMNVEVGDIIGFCVTTDNQLVITSGQLANDLTLLGSSTLTTSKSVTLPKKVREHLNVKKGDKLAYYEEGERRVNIES